MSEVMEARMVGGSGREWRSASGTADGGPEGGREMRWSVRKEEGRS